MTTRTIAVLSIIALTAPAIAGDEPKLPPEVTPQLRAACEVDVRRLCVTPASTTETVRACVMSNFLRLGRRCQVEIASAGLAP